MTLEELKIKLDKENTWLLYLLPMFNISFNPQVPTACGYIRGGKSYIEINPTVWEVATNEERLNILKHEIGHFLYGHHGINLKDYTLDERQLLNQCCDCSLHVNIADPDEIDAVLNRVYGGTINVCRYEQFGMPVLPYHILFEILRNRQKEGQGGHGRSKSSCDSLSNQRGDGTPTDAVIIVRELNEQLEKARAKGVETPKVNGLFAGSERGSRGFEFEQKHVGNWVSKLLEYLIKQLSSRRIPSYRRDGRQKLVGGLLTKGKSRVYEPVRLVYLIDASGSISNEDLNLAISIAKKFVYQYHLRGSAYIFDTEVSPEIPINAWEGLANHAKKYGGGTKFQPALDVVKPDDIAVMITDTYCFENKLDTSHLRYLPVILTQTVRSNVANAVKTWRIIHINED